MQKRRIGSLEVSMVGLGCNNFGGRLDAERTAEVLHAAIDAGINFFDTADVYGGTRSEEFMGQALRSRRAEVLIATKYGIKLDDARPGGAKPEYIRRAVEDSLRRLQTDYIDLYQLHFPDEHTPIAETLEAMNQLVQAGKVREIGCSNFSAAQLQEAQSAVKPGAARFVSVQNHYSLFHREPEAEVLPACEQLGLALLPYFPLANGLLTGRYRKGQPVPEGTRIQPGTRPGEALNDENLDRVERLIAFAQARGHSILDLAFAWLLAHGPVASVIAGATRVAQVQANVNAADWTLTTDEVAEINGLL